MMIKLNGFIFLLNIMTIWDKVISDIKKESDSEPVYNKKFLKTKIKCYGEEATDFHNKGGL